MARQFTWVLALLVICASAAAAAAAPQSRPVPAAQSGKDGADKPQPAGSPRSDRWKWWLYDRAELGITDQQSKDINGIFESTITKLRESRHELDRAEGELSRTIREHKVDVAAMSGLLDRVESARSHHNKMRTLMLYRMHLVLTADQRVKLEALRARRDAERKDGPPPGSRRFP